jgi:hypothetical protein
VSDSNGDYRAFISGKQQKGKLNGFKPLWMPDFLFDFQAKLTDWAVRKGRAAIFADCGLGKTPISLVWADNVVRNTGKPVLILTPLAVAPQFVREGDKFGVPVHHASDGRVKKGVNVVNYDRRHYFLPSDFGGLVCDESGCLKHHDTKTRHDITRFASEVPYVLLGTATPAPNDFMELGNSAEVLGVMGYSQMLGMFFTNDGKTTSQWRLRGHAKRVFWRWVSGWARAMRMPSDLGYDDDGFILPPLDVNHHMVASPGKDGRLIYRARTLNEQRAERRATLRQRCERVAELVPGDRPFIAWCHLNVEGDLLERLIPDAVQVKGSDKVEDKESRLDAFSRGNLRVLVSKPVISGWGLNWQHCSDVSFFPSHSYEQWYQAIRRCWRFGQSRRVEVGIVASEAERLVVSSMLRKEKQARELYDGIIRGMGEFQSGKKVVDNEFDMEVEVPEWL